MAGSGAQPTSEAPPSEDIPFGSRFTDKLLENLYDGVYFVDRERRILYWNKGAERISGFAAGEVVGQFCHANILDHVNEDGRHFCHDGCPLTEAVTRGKSSVTRVVLKHRDGRRIPVDVSVMPAIDDDGQVLGGVEIFRDASSVVALETTLREMRDLAERDSLTGLANRRHLDEMLRLQHEVFRRTGQPFSVIMADVDHFKRINDTCGHQAGDQALIAFAHELETTCRPHDIVGRYGGEEFLVILRETMLADALVVADRMRQATPRASLAAMAPQEMTASFGVAEADQFETADDLTRRADSALYQAKESGRDCVRHAPRERSSLDDGQAPRGCARCAEAKADPTPLAPADGRGNAV
jgi:diguanylate cyclase (GGDEF)-like protein/PAS domain S-box-containing protein